MSVDQCSREGWALFHANNTKQDDPAHTYAYVLAYHDSEWRAVQVVEAPYDKGPRFSQANVRSKLGDMADRFVVGLNLTPSDFAENPSEPITDKLTFEGLGSLKLGRPTDKLIADGWVRPHPGKCNLHDTTNQARDSQVSFVADTSLKAIVLWIGTSTSTDNGAKPGMTFGEVEALYGSELQYTTKKSLGRDMAVGMVRRGDVEMIFTVDKTGSIVESDRVGTIELRAFSPNRQEDGC